jgi:hypothetical protein
VSNEAFDWLVVLTLWVAVIGLGAFVGMVWESWAEWRRERRQRLPPPAWRARVVRRWGVPE